jgi:hypothetical protein
VTDPAAELDALLAARDRRQRLGAAPMDTVAELASWLEGAGLALASGKSAVPNAAEAITGAAIDGSWWGHGEGSRIYRLLTGLEEEGRGFLDVVVIDGKRTLVAPALVPSVFAVASDEDRRERVIAGLKLTARRLLGQLAEAGEVRAADTGLGAKEYRVARVALEAALLARSTSEHTESGHHESVLALIGGGGPGGGGSRDGLASLCLAAVMAAVVADRREAERWLRHVEPDASRRASAIDSLGLRELVVGGRTWLSVSAPRK